MDLNNILNNSIDERRTRTLSRATQQNSSNTNCPPVSPTIQSMAVPKSHLRERRLSSNYTHSSPNPTLARSVSNSPNGRKSNDISIRETTPIAKNDKPKASGLFDEEEPAIQNQLKQKRARSVDSTDEDDEEDEGTESIGEGTSQPSKSSNKKKRSKAPNSSWSVEEDTKLVSLGDLAWNQNSNPLD